MATVRRRGPSALAAPDAKQQIGRHQHQSENRIARVVAGSRTEETVLTPPGVT